MRTVRHNINIEYSLRAPRREEKDREVRRDGAYRFVLLFGSVSLLYQADRVSGNSKTLARKSKPLFGCSLDTYTGYVDREGAGDIASHLTNVGGHLWSLCDYG